MKTRILGMIPINEENTKKSIFPGDRTGKIHLRQRCNSCDIHIIKTVKSVDGVLMAKWKAKSGTLIIKFDNRKTSLNKIEWEIAKAGHDTPSYRGNIKFYSHIPKCCQYREELNGELQ